MTRAFGFQDFLYVVMATRWTILLFVVATIGGSVLAALLVLMRLSEYRVVRWIAIAWVALIQGTPLLIQLFLALFLPIIFGIQVSPLVAACVALSINGGAFLSEIWRGAVVSVPKGQWEAGTALGLSYLQRMRLVIFPQVIRLATPATVGFLVQFLKATALTSIIGFVDLTRAGQLVITATARPLTVLGTVALIYFALCWPLSWLSRVLETRLAPR